MGRLIGIDLGTTNTVVAVADGPQAKILDSREGRPQSASAVGLRASKKNGGSRELLVGDTAVDNWPMAPLDTIVSVKRLMGRGVDDEEVQRLKRTARYEIVQPSDGTKQGVRVV